jgi:DNA invertase Pin-like site-specific DNA recombinase
MFFQILGAIAEFAHALMSERTLDGLTTARARDRTGGQEAKLTPRQVHIAKEMYEETDINGRRVHRRRPDRRRVRRGVTRRTICRYLAKPPASADHQRDH